MRKSISILLIAFCFISLSQFAQKAQSAQIIVHFADLDIEDEFPDSIIHVFVNGTELGSDRSIAWNANDNMSVKMYFAKIDYAHCFYQNEFNITESTTFYNLIDFTEYRIQCGNSRVNYYFESSDGSFDSFGTYSFFIPTNLSVSMALQGAQWRFRLYLFNPLDEFNRDYYIYHNSFREKKEFGFNYDSLSTDNYTYYQYQIEDSSYNSLKINLYNPSGIGIPVESMKVMVDGNETRNGIAYWLYSQLMYETDGLTYVYYKLNLTIYDYFNGMVYSKNITVYGMDSEGDIPLIESIDIFVPIYTVNIAVNSSSVGYLEICRSDLSDYLVRVPTKNIDSFQYTLLANKIYTFKYYVNDVIVEEKTYTITETRDIEFGYWTIQSTVTPESPLPEINYSALIFIFALYAILIVIISIPQKSKNRIPKFKF